MVEVLTLSNFKPPSLSEPQALLESLTQTIQKRLNTSYIDRERVLLFYENSNHFLWQNSKYANATPDYPMFNYSWMSSMKVTYAVQGTLLYRLHERLEKFCEVVPNELKPPISFWSFFAFKCHQTLLSKHLVYRK